MFNEFIFGEVEKNEEIRGHYIYIFNYLFI